jgi:FtsH-binding integral membrane protein
MVNSSLYNLLYNGGQNGGAKIKSSFTNFSSLLNDKKGLMIMVFANLITQLGITYYVMTNTKVTEKDNHNLKHLLLIISTFIIIWILALVPMPSWLKFILFSAFSYIWGILLASFKLKINDNNLINMTMLGSIGIFAVMFLIGGFLLATGIKLGLKTGAFLFFSLLLLIIFQIFNLFYRSTMLVKTLSAIGIIIFSGYIIYDTNIILQRDYYGDFITASLDYYLDILNIFLKLTVLNDN